ncbi:MAG TPA: hypothetical protein VES02_06900 [Dermatophilaceae bacterium]|nr:hypothetical protein [Dermatophilaceae bacterium]
MEVTPWVAILAPKNSARLSLNFDWTRTTGAAILPIRPVGTWADMSG